MNKEIIIKNYDKPIPTIDRLLEENGLTPMIEFIVYRKSDGDDLIIKYKLVKDEGKFINFGGLNLNTESGYFCIGYNSNNDSYIPLFKIDELLNNILFGDEDVKLLDTETAVYIVERIKLEGESFDVISFVGDLIKSKNHSKSIILSLISSVNLLNNEIKVGNNDEFYEILTEFFSWIIKSVDKFAKSLLGNFIHEYSRNEVLRNMNKTYDDVDVYKERIEGLYLKLLKDKNIDPIFLRELSSCGLGIKRRNSLLKVTGISDIKKFLILSSWAYIEVWDSASFDSLSNDKIYAYNLFDILRAIDREQDIFFGYDMLNSLNIDKYIDTLIKKLQVVSEVNNIGYDNFLRNIRSYAKNVSLLRDMGSSYASRMKFEQKDFLVYSSKGLINSGKIVDKIAKRILKKFS